MESLAFEGRLDLDFQIIMAVAPHVHRYVEQPETFHFKIGDRTRRYTPDGLAYTTLGRIYFEVKPALKLARSPDLDGRLDAIINECARRGAEFNIVTETQIRKGKLLSNATAVWSAAQAFTSLEAQSVCRLLRTVTFPTTMREIGSMLGPRRWARVKALIGLRYLAADLSKALSDDTVITRGAKDW